MKPILNIDVWEHAYYLKHYNQRAAYIGDWFHVVNWNKAEKSGFWQLNFPLLLSELQQKPRITVRGFSLRYSPHRIRICSTISLYNLISDCLFQKWPRSRVLPGHNMPEISHR